MQKILVAATVTFAWAQVLSSVLTAYLGAKTQTWFTGILLDDVAFSINAFVVTPATAIIAVIWSSGFLGYSSSDKTSGRSKKQK
jgi:hypothetical protein